MKASRSDGHLTSRVQRKPAKPLHLGASWSPRRSAETRRWAPTESSISLPRGNERPAVVSARRPPRFATERSPSRSASFQATEPDRAQRIRFPLTKGRPYPAEAEREPPNLIPASEGPIGLLPKALRKALPPPGQSRMTSNPAPGATAPTPRMMFSSRKAVSTFPVGSDTRASPLILSAERCGSVMANRADRPISSLLPPGRGCGCCGTGSRSRD